jgi:hypothetical protein
MEVCSQDLYASIPRDHFVDIQEQATYFQERRSRMAWRKPWQIPTANRTKVALLQIEATSQVSVACMIQALGTCGRYPAHLIDLEAWLVAV